MVTGQTFTMAAAGHANLCRGSTTRLTDLIGDIRQWRAVKMQFAIVAYWSWAALSASGCPVISTPAGAASNVPDLALRSPAPAVLRHCFVFCSIRPSTRLNTPIRPQRCSLASQVLCSTLPASPSSCGCGRRSGATGPGMVGRPRAGESRPYAIVRRPNSSLCSVDSRNSKSTSSPITWDRRYSIVIVTSSKTWISGSLRSSIVREWERPMAERSSSPPLAAPSGAPCRRRDARLGHQHKLFALGRLHRLQSVVATAAHDLRHGLADLREPRLHRGHVGAQRV
jgi:hypothetical protein